MTCNGERTKEKSSEINIQGRNATFFTKDSGFRPPEPLALSSHPSNSFPVENDLRVRG